MIFTLMGKTGDSIAPVALLGTHRTLPSSLAFSSGVLGTAGGALGTDLGSCGRNGVGGVPGKTEW